MYLSPLADIVSVYIPRELNGLLKESFKVTCVDRSSALMLHDLLTSSFDDLSNISHDGEASNDEEKSQQKVKNGVVPAFSVSNLAKFLLCDTLSHQFFIACT